MNTERDVPIPENAGPFERGKYDKVCREMQCGESFMAPHKDTARARVAASRVGTDQGKKFVTRSVDGGIRVWRVE